MSDHAPRSFERHCDVCIIGGSAAGLAAALHLGRERRSVIVIDAGPARHAGVSDLQADGREEVRSHGGEILAGRAVQVTGRRDDRFRVELAGGHSVLARRVLAAGGLVEELPGIDGLSVPGGLLKTDATGATSVPGVYAVGYLVDPGEQVPRAAAQGRRVGAVISSGLVEDDIGATARPSANQTDWDHRYGGDRVWSGNPNGTLVAEVTGLAPGRALDVGAGEGGDALWLAEQGWTVTASDISQRALATVEAAAARRGLRVECRQADANDPHAFGTATFDLVAASYASIPRTPDGRAVRNLLDAVAPGGTLLIVGHDLEPMRAPVDTRSESRPFDPDAFVRVDDFAAALAGSPAWDVQVHEKRPRPAGAASASHHADDVVLRARRSMA